VTEHRLSGARRVYHASAHRAVAQEGMASRRVVEFARPSSKTEKITSKSVRARRRVTQHQRERGLEMARCLAEMDESVAPVKAEWKRRIRCSSQFRTPGSCRRTTSRSRGAAGSAYVPKIIRDRDLATRQLPRCRRHRSGHPQRPCRRRPLPLAASACPSPLNIAATARSDRRRCVEESGIANDQATRHYRAPALRASAQRRDAHHVQLGLHDIRMGLRERHKRHSSTITSLVSASLRSS